MAQFFEAIMVICFGLSWPAAVLKSYRTRTAKGKSLVFQMFIWIGYVAGILGKIVSKNLTYVFVFYIINITMVSVDIAIYFRNRKLDQLAGQV